MIHYSLQIVEPKHITRGNVTACNWGRLMQQRLSQQYPDMTVEVESDQKTNTLTFGFEFKNRPTSEADVRSRLFDFLRYNPAIKIHGLRLLA